MLKSYLETGVRRSEPAAYPPEVRVMAVSPASALAVACMRPGYPAVVGSDGRHSTDPSLCERLVTACAENPLDANTYSTPSLGTHLTPSVEFPDFCELTVLDATDATMYQDCTALTGYAVKLTTGPAGLECRFIAPMRCPSDLNRTRVDRCQYLERRLWANSLSSGCFGGNTGSCKISDMAPSPGFCTHGFMVWP